MNQGAPWGSSWEIAVLAVLCGIGVLTLLGGALYGVDWLMDHVRLVP